MPRFETIELVAENDEERTLLRHVRGDCHNGAICPLCKARALEQQAILRLESIITG